MAEISTVQLPGLNCGLCGYRTCEEFQDRLATAPRCFAAASIFRSADFAPRLRRSRHERLPPINPSGLLQKLADNAGQSGGRQCTAQTLATIDLPGEGQQPVWRDHLGREFDFFLEHFPEEPGPREIILPHNPLLTREMDIQRGDVLIGRPLGMSCGCPVTHCGVVMEADHRTGVLVWCVTGPLTPRQKGYKDLGYYVAEAYEGLVKQTRCELKLGLRYFFQPRMCMLQWRHSGLINYLSRNADGYQIRIEGLWIG